MHRKLFNVNEMNKFNCKNLNLIQLFQSTNETTRKIIIQQGNKQIIELLIEIILNTLNSNIPITSKLKSKIKKDKNTLRSVSDINKRESILCKRKKLIKINKSLALLCTNFCMTDSYKLIRQKCLAEEKKN